MSKSSEIAWNRSKIGMKYFPADHGILSKYPLVNIPGAVAENPNDFEKLYRGLKKDFSPQGSTQNLLVQKIAVNFWRLKRLYNFEVRQLESETVNLMNKGVKPSRAIQLAQLNEKNSQLVQRYNSSIERSIQRDIALLKSLDSS